jgi:putative ABC transport system permease protein
VCWRLRSDVSLGAARAEISAIGQQLKREHGQAIDAVSFAAGPPRERMVKDVRRVLVLLSAAVALLLLIACSNVGNLLLVRATVRRKELALRAALGASRSQLARQFITEALLLTMCGAVFGVLLAFWGVDLIVALYHGNLPHIGEISVDRNVLLFAFASAIIIGVVLGAVPVLHASARQLHADLQEAGRDNQVAACIVAFATGWWSRRSRSLWCCWSARVCSVVVFSGCLRSNRGSRRRARWR